MLVLSTPALAARFDLGSALGWPLEGSARALRGGFGESRSNHFHAGLDLSTDRHVGMRVVAPGDGEIERVRASGVGYGRSLYYRLRDGRLLVFGHLDAFEPRVAAYIDSVQRLSGDYEQDLLAPAGMFRFAKGELLAWSGESGAGPPHLHVEVRREDFALNPLLAGLGVADTLAPSIETLVLEPLDERSWVERRATPYTHRVRAARDTIMVEGRVRLTLVAHDATREGRALPVREVEARWNGGWVRCRMDSISWAGEMAQIHWLVDDGRVTGSEGVILDAPPGWRPRFVTSSRADSLAIDLVQVADGAGPRELQLFARDAAGNETSRSVWLRGPRWGELGPDSTRVGRVAAVRKRKRAAAAPVAADPVWQFACLPEQRVRVRVTGAPDGLRNVRIERGGTRPETSTSVPASWDGRGWSAVLYMNGVPDPDGLWIKGKLADGKAWWHRGSYSLWPTGSAMITKLDDWAWLQIGPDQAYEQGVVMVRSAPIDAVAPGASGIRAALEVQPADLPVRKPVWVTLKLPPGVSAARTGIGQRDHEGRGWDWNDAIKDTVGGTLRIETSHFGQFAILRDEAPP
ncbi:MAG: M23 family metallopeptidase, partial [Candidatus Eisenbacteria bacterium]|nr:M23 family metallopeptidase [Candidatus Eisenbacteria bacterium]